MSTKKLLLSILLLAISCAAVWAQPTQLTIEGLVGNVKRVDERRSDVEVVDGVRKERKASTEFSKVFDQQGRVVAEFVTGENIVETKHTYSKDGIRRTMSETTRPFEKPNAYKRPSVSATRFTYDASENSISEDHLSGRDFGDSVVEMMEYGRRLKYFFDSSNRLTKKLVMDSNLKEVSTYEYFYRGDGPPTEVVLTLGGRALQMIKYTYELDAQGNWTKRESEAKTSNPANPIAADVVYRKISYYK
jgi:YD repeat-containing protein